MKRALIFFLLSGLFLSPFSGSARAEVSIGGRIFVDGYYLARNKENAIWKKVGDSPFTNIAIQIPNITRFHVRWTNEENVGMYVEFGLGQTNGSTEGGLIDGVNLRHAFGWWDIAPTFQILAGHTSTPISPLMPFQMIGTRSGSLNIIGEGYGEVYSGRFPQIRGTYAFNSNMKLAVAVIDPNGSSASVPYGEGNVAYQKSTKLPRVDVGLPVTLGLLRIFPSFLFQQRRVEFLPGAKDLRGLDNQINTYIGSLGVKTGFGPFQLSAEGNWGQNWGNTPGGIGVSPPAVNSSATIYNNQLDNTTTYGFWVDLACTFGPVTPHLLCGQMKSTGSRNPMEYSSRFWGVSTPIEMSKGLTLIPEFMWYDDGDDNTRLQP